MFDIFQHVGEVKTVYTLVDFYQYIKGVEYLICVAFFVGFPILYRYINSDKDKISNRASSAKETHR